MVMILVNVHLAEKKKLNEKNDFIIFMKAFYLGKRNFLSKLLSGEKIRLYKRFPLFHFLLKLFYFGSIQDFYYYRVYLFCFSPQLLPLIFIECTIAIFYTTPVYKPPTSWPIFTVQK